ncbi:MAG: hypothetical protein K2J76_03290 [Oscillospiraceae bacterium]|nr:hypothetical protein [Oscillospiraceae bacterium]
MQKTIGGMQKAVRDGCDRELLDIFRLFYNDVPISFEIIDTSRGDADFRETVIAEFETGEKSVLKLADNDFTFPEKIEVWRRTAEEYRTAGYYCPKIFPDKAGNYPVVRYKGHSCISYAEDFSPYRPAEYRSENASEEIPAAEYEKEAWIMTAKIASKYFSYTDYPSAYCLFETFCPSDKTDEVLENTLEWKKYAQTLPEEFRPQTERIWRLWTENRKKLELIYKKLPTSVFQADLNSTNILLDGSGKFVGVYDFNLCGKDVFLNYLFRETFYDDYKKELDAIFRRLKIVSEYYHFSEVEKQAALMLYRCLKPLWYNKLERLKELGNDTAAVGAYLNETERSLTEDIDFTLYMN